MAKQYRELKRDEIVHIGESIGAMFPTGPAGFWATVNQDPFVVGEAIEAMPWELRKGIPLTTFIIAAMAIGFQMAIQADESQTTPTTDHD